jgi:signal transduction histidine kinase
MLTVIQNDANGAPHRHTCVVRKVGTFDADGPNMRGADEVRQNNAQPAQGVDGYNIPSLLGMATGAPYLHNGAAGTLEELLSDTFKSTSRPATRCSRRPPQELADLIAFVQSIDEDTMPIPVPDNQRFCPGHLTPAMYGFRSYISVPIVLPDGSFFGTLCAIDPVPARLNTPEVRGMFTAFAELIALHLDARRRLDATEASLMNERRTAELREQFIAVLGHDLRNPLAAISGGLTVLRHTQAADNVARVLSMMQRSVEQMTGLIDNVLDFARGRMGGGLDVARREEPLRPLLMQVIEELRGARPDRRIVADIDLPRPVRCDRVRIGQLVSNLIANALTHGDPRTPVRVTAAIVDELFELTVANAGEPIPAAMLAGLFEPFVRASARPSQQGLGLGLYIASEIARAHGGLVTAASNAGETRFTFRMPVDGGERQVSSRTQAANTSPRSP